MCQPVPHPFALTNLVTPALDAIVHAISDRGNQTEAQRLAKANQALTLILSYLPCDVIDMTLAGQTVMFNELLADGARDVLRGMADTAKQRSFSSLIGMGRLVQGHLDRLEKRGCKPYRTEVAAPEAEKPITPEAAPRQKPAAATPQPIPAPAPQGKPTNTPHPAPPDPAAAASWLDEPYEQWLVETPADLAWRVDQREAAPTAPMRRANAAGPAHTVAAHAVAAEGLRPIAPCPGLPGSNRPASPLAGRPGSDLGVARSGRDPGYPRFRPDRRRKVPAERVETTRHLAGRVLHRRHVRRRGGFGHIAGDLRRRGALLLDRGGGIHLGECAGDAGTSAKAMKER